jgi:leucyl-tRNA synthetase
VQAWPEADPAIAAEDTVTMVLQVNGKVRDRVDVPVSVSEEEAETAAFASEKVQQWIEGKDVRKVIVRTPKLVNIVVG